MNDDANTKIVVELAFALVEQPANKIFLPNPEANEDDYVKGFHLTKREYEMVRGRQTYNWRE